jgi:hypothetical protein
MQRCRDVLLLYLPMLPRQAVRRVEKRCTKSTPVGFSLPPEGKKNNSRIKFDSDFTADSYTFDEAQPSTLNTPTNGLMRCHCDGLIAPRIVPLSEDGSIAAELSAQRGYDSAQHEFRGLCLCTSDYGNVV